MLELIGDDYIAQHVQQQILAEQRERQYRTYITDALMLLTSQEGKLTKRWCDLYPDYLNRHQAPERTAEEIKTHLLGLFNAKEGRPDESI